MYAGPRIPEIDSLEAVLDPSSDRLIPDDQVKNNTTPQLGLSQWYCFSGGTAQYSAPYPGTIIYEKNAQGDINTVVSETSDPQRGTFTITATYTYFSNLPIHLIDNGDQHNLVPIGYKGRFFIHRTDRGGTDTYRFYNPNSTSVTLNMYTGSSGINDTVYQSFTINSLSQTSTTLGTEDIEVYFSSSQDIAGTVQAGGNDRMILSPAATSIYMRRNQYEKDIFGGGPSNGSYYVTSSNPCYAQEIADGSGGDACQHIPKDYLCTHYSFGGTLSDFHITAPYPDTEVKTFVYLDDKWTLATTHNLNGSLTNPAVSRRDYVYGISTEGSSANDFGSGTKITVNGETPDHWYWVSNNPIGIWINDLSNDEEPLMGWTGEVKSIATRKTYNNKATLNTVRKINKVFEFNGGTDFIAMNTITFGNGAWTVNMWVNFEGTGNINMMSNSDGGPVTNAFGHSSSKIAYKNYDGSWNTHTGNTTLSSGTWYMFTWVNYSNSTMKMYVNGISDVDAAFDSTTTNGGPCDVIGKSYGNDFYEGKIGQFRYWSKSLDDTQIQRVYKNTRNRFGI